MYKNDSVYMISSKTENIEKLVQMFIKGAQIVFLVEEGKLLGGVTGGGYTSFSFIE